MGLFDFIFGNKKKEEQERLERERQAELQRKENERRKMIDELRAGAKVVFAGGIIGTIQEASEKTFVIETASGATMEVLRSAVQGLYGAEAPAK